MHACPYHHWRLPSAVTFSTIIAVASAKRAHELYTFGQQLNSNLHVHIHTNVHSPCTCRTICTHVYIHCTCMCILPAHVGLHVRIQCMAEYDRGIQPVLVLWCTTLVQSHTSSHLFFTAKGQVHYRPQISLYVCPSISSSTLTHSLSIHSSSISFFTSYSLPPEYHNSFTCTVHVLYIYCTYM